MATMNDIGVGLKGSTGTGSFAGSTSPTFVTPVLGTPASGVLTNMTGSQIGSSAGSFVSAGQVGEVISSVVLQGGAVVTLANNVAANITSISLTAGNWIIFGNVSGTYAAIVSNIYGWISATSATFPDNAFTASVNVEGNASNVVVPMTAVRLSGTTTYYLSAQSAFLSTAPAVYGAIYAIRIP